MAAPHPPLHHIETGAGTPVVFLHGNPTSSHLWRGVLPLLPPGLRLIAPDLIGMGASDKPAIDYTLPQHIAYVEDLLDALELTGVVLVAHDWGVAISLDLLRRHPGRFTGFAFMEGHLRPLAGWDAFDAGGRDLFRRLREPGTGERMVLEENFLVETLLPNAVTRPLAPDDLDAYRRPYPDPPSRRPLLQWTREIPIGGQPAHSAEILGRGWEHLCASPVPKLLIHARPGAVVTPATVDECRASLPNLTTYDAGPGGHFLPEDAPSEVATALTRWLARPAHRREGA